MKKLKFATVWLDGCSGCHMSFLDIDERLLTLMDKVDLVYSPLVDFKEYPEDVDIVLIEGSVSNEDDLAKIRKVRARTKTLIALGDCAVNGNIPAMRNSFKLDDVYERAYIENAATNPQIPREGIPALLKKVVPVHQVVDVDIHVPGCPPPADAIFQVLSDLLEGKTPEPEKLTRFGK